MVKSTVVTGTPSYTVYTDGACKGNPGPGGWAAVILTEGGTENITSGNSNGNTVTNNQMELRAVIEGLKHTDIGSTVTVYSDSKYVVDCFRQDWLTSWKKNKWRRRDGKKLVPVLNKELWVELVELVEARNVLWNWVRAHNGNALNEQADAIAQSEAGESSKKWTPPPPKYEDSHAEEFIDYLAGRG